MTLRDWTDVDLLLERIGHELEGHDRETMHATLLMNKQAPVLPQNRTVGK